MPHVPGHNGNRSGGNQTNLVTSPNQFINRRTGLPVPAGMPYHIHPDKGPMAGAVHNPNIEGGTQGHDFYDSIATTRTGMMNTNMVRPVRTRQDSQRRQNMSMSTPRRATSSSGGSGGGYRRGGRVNNRRKMMHGGSHSRNNGCGPGMMYQDGGCVPASGGMRRGGRTRRYGVGGRTQTSGNSCPPGMMMQNGQCVSMPSSRMSSGMSGGYRTGGRTRRRFQQGGHTHSIQAYGYGHTHENGQTIYDPNSVSMTGIVGMDPNNNLVPLNTTTHTAGEHTHRTGIQTTRRMMHGGPHNGASDHHRKSAKRDSRGRK